MTHTYNLTSWEAEAGLSQLQGQPGPHRKLLVCMLGDLNLCNSLLSDI